jgi:hypothetical protein
MKIFIKNLQILFLLHRFIDMPHYLVELDALLFHLMELII